MVNFSARSEVLDNMSPFPSSASQPNPSPPLFRPPSQSPRQRRRRHVAAGQPMEGISDDDTRSSHAAKVEADMQERREEFAQFADRERYQSSRIRTKEQPKPREQHRKHHVVVEIVSDSEEDRAATSRLLDTDDDHNTSFPSDDDIILHQVDDDGDIVLLPDQTGAREFPIELSPEPADEAEKLEQYVRSKEFERDAEKRKDRLREKRAKEEFADHNPLNGNQDSPRKRRDRETKMREQNVAEVLRGLRKSWNIQDKKLQEEADNQSNGQEAEWKWRGDEFARATDKIRKQAEAARNVEAERAERLRHPRSSVEASDSDVEIVEPLPTYDQLKRIRAEFQAAEREKAKINREAEERQHRRREAEAARHNKEVEDHRASVEAARRERREERKRQAQREAAARALKEAKEIQRRVAEQRRELQRKLMEEEAEIMRRMRAEEERRRAEDMLRREQEEARRIQEEKIRLQREEKEREERERCRREADRNAERIRLAFEREQKERWHQQQQQQRARGAHTYFGPDDSTFRSFFNNDFRPGAGHQNRFGGGFGDAFRFQQYTEGYGRTYTSAGFAHPPPRAAPGPSSIPKANRPKINLNPAPEDVTVAFTAYEQRWAGLNSLPDTPAWTFSTIPWPVTYPVSSPHGLEALAVRRFLLATVHSQGKNKKDRVRAAMLRWHPDKFCPKWLGKVKEGDQEAVREGVNAVARILQDLQTECT